VAHARGASLIVCGAGGGGGVVTLPFLPVFVPPPYPTTAVYSSSLRPRIFFSASVTSCCAQILVWVTLCEQSPTKGLWVGGGRGRAAVCVCCLVPGRGAVKTVDGVGGMYADKACVHRAT
jgi:hypothetical protein